MPIKLVPCLFYYGEHSLAMPRQGLLSHRFEGLPKDLTSISARDELRCKTIFFERIG